MSPVAAKAGAPSATSPMVAAPTASPRRMNIRSPLDVREPRGRRGGGTQPHRTSARNRGNPRTCIPKLTQTPEELRGGARGGILELEVGEALKADQGFA